MGLYVCVYARVCEISSSMVISSGYTYYLLGRVELSYKPGHFRKDL